MQPMEGSCGKYSQMIITVGARKIHEWRGSFRPYVVLLFCTIARIPIFVHDDVWTLFVFTRQLYLLSLPYNPVPALLAAPHFILETMEGDGEGTDIDSPTLHRAGSGRGSGAVPNATRRDGAFLSQS